jgi:hypothetical protein
MEVSAKEWMSMLLTRYQKELELRMEAITALRKEVYVFSDYEPVPEEIFNRWQQRFEDIRDGSFFEK